MRIYYSPMEKDEGSWGHRLPEHEITHEEIAELAYDMYLSSGRVQGQCRENWEKAEHSLRDHGHCQTQARGAEDTVPQEIQ